MMLSYRKFFPKRPVLDFNWYFCRPCDSVRRRLPIVRSCQTVAELKQDSESSISFNDTKIAYRSKTTREIVRSLFVFRLCSVNYLVDNNLKLMKYGKKFLGERMFNSLMKATFYGHFVGGEDQVALKPVVTRLQKFGVGAILDYSVEEDIDETSTGSSSESEGKTTPKQAPNKEIVKQFQLNKDFADRRKKVISARTYFYEDEHKCDLHLETFLKCIDAVGYASDNGFAAIKLTALGRPQLLLRLSEILYQTKYHFDQMASQCAEGRIMNRRIARDGFFKGLLKLGMQLGEEEANAIFDTIDITKSGDIDIIEWSHFLTPQLELSKLFQASPDDASDPVISALTDAELQQMESMRDRLHQLAKRAMEQNVRLMVDAEQTYFQPAISRLTLDMQRLYNREKPIILNTYQCYLKDAYNSVETDMELARREGFKFGAKIVRGAYMEQEKARAQAMNYEDPIQPDYRATCDNYNKIVSTILEEVKRSGANIVVASHNEDSVVFTLQRMIELSIPRDQGGVYFAQLLGMCDQVSFILGQSGYNVFKYVPYGSVSDVLPYLSRRAAENRGLLDGVLKERKLLWKELKRRLREKELNYDPHNANVLG
ncbi:proline dehydrogenase 1, mitochondrial-like [Dendronephthya gigantea]|uniref:proline dehydrogenase 1, mitochondrial-like n=1 Tax=Dendronephthya gigantea TaxID=151771 RepID=UPI00106CD67F|nr:proline dehydrogenase 1, mitochondrial-like [Dendronephthya gigantea]